MAHENSFGVEIILSTLRECCSDVLFYPGKRNVPILSRDGHRCFGFCSYPHERDPLEVAAVLAARLNAFSFQLIRNVLRRQLLTVSSHTASFESITREVFNVLSNFLARDGRQLSTSGDGVNGAEQR